MEKGCRRLSRNCLFWRRDCKKMSKSKGEGLFLSELKLKYGDRCMEKIIMVGKYCFDNQIKNLNYEKLRKFARE